MSAGHRRQIAKDMWPAICSAIVGAALLALPTVGATAQPANAAPQAYSISFVEIQTEASENPRIMRQRNTVRLTLRPLGQFDFERERNSGSISKAYLYRMATGAPGRWVEASHGSRVRVSTGASEIVIEQHGSNFTQRFVITTTGKTCKVAIAYAVDPGPEAPTVFKMIEIVTRKPLRLASLVAADITCSVGGVAMY